jgi:DNA-binding transcriptional LysR family regulator
MDEGHHDEASSGVAAAVLRREAEFGINVAEAHHPDLLATTLLKDDFVLICRDDHALAHRKSLRWKELEPHRLIYAGAWLGYRRHCGGCGAAFGYSEGNLSESARHSLGRAENFARSGFAAPKDRAIIACGSGALRSDQEPGNPGQILKSRRP